ncbi:hypothetical protein [Sporichthya sp.]|uniref:hypothetical protein n=1 Tax=Sporichthya sp. TaxID=65475 RepID=UPI00184C8B9F|nr:hypothetical protein [Sporichthya sp.]MBA3743095.1 hypothetical protein [Sporichthya sp.]
MTITEPIAPVSIRPGGLKPFFVRGLLTCLSGTAAIGIYAVLVGSFSSTGVRILTSTLLVGIFCMLSLIAVSVLDTRFRSVGTAGISTACTALAQGLFLIWSVGDEMPDDTMFLLARGFFLAGIVAVALAHAALLLRIDLAGSGPITAVRAATLTTMTFVAVLVAAPLVHTEVWDHGAYWRLLGSLAILDVLGTVCLPVLARFEARSTR